MSDQKYRTAAALVFVKIGIELLMLVFLGFMFATGSRTVGLVGLRGIVLILTSLLTVYILFTLRRLLWDRYDFHQMDVIIPVVACTGVILEILNQATELIQVLNPRDEASIISARVLLIVIPWGIITIVFAAGLLKLPFSENSLLRPYAYLNLGTGIVVISMILILVSPVFGFLLFPLILLMGLAADVLLALTFLRSRETEQLEFV
jgi:hypothetical protein